jgi:phospholipase D1/2
MEHASSGDHGGMMTRNNNEPRILERGRNCWRIAHADRAAFLIDGDAYFTAFRAAAARAQRSILILGWDVDSRTVLAFDEPRDGLPLMLGDFLFALVQRQRTLRIHVLDWDFAMIFALEREFLPIYTQSWRSHRRLRFHLDDRHPAGASHHQKIVVIDDEIAFVGGLDLTTRRWDTPGHDAGDARRVDPGGEAYAPFHDVQMMVDGDAAAALGQLARERWRRATGVDLRSPQNGRSNDLWPDGVATDLTDVDVAIARTEPADEAHEGVQEIKQLYLDAIAAAQRWIYFENQFFASAAIGDALAQRLAEADGPEIVIVSRLRGGGWLEQNTMEVLRSRLLRRLRDADRHGRLRIYYPEHRDLDDGVCIQLHSKLMLADGTFLRIGSANVANRSMGLDTECDLAIETREPRVGAAVDGLRDRLLGEHLGVEPDAVADAIGRRRSLIGGIEALRGGKRTLEPLDIALDPELDKLVPDAAIVDPERPIDADQLVSEFVPRSGRPHAGRRIAISAASIIALAALAAAWRWGPLASLIDEGALEQAAEWIRSSSLAPLWILLAYVTASLAAIPITLLIVATALVFGPFTSFAYALTGSLAGAAVGFAVGRAVGRRAVRAVAGRRLNHLSRHLARRGLLAIVAVRVLPVAPFTVVNLVAGASYIHPRDFMLGTLIGMAPGLVAVTLFSDRLFSVLHDPSPLAISTLVGVITLIAAGAIAAHRWLGQRTATPAPNAR